MEIVPGVRYVDLETDRGRFSTYARQSSVDDVEDLNGVADAAHDTHGVKPSPVKQPV